MPPRTPGRSDAQVPSDAARGESKYGRIPFVYFYRKMRQADPAFGLLDIEIAIQRRGLEAFACEIYAIGDGYQSGHGSSELQPLAIEFRAGARTVAQERMAISNRAQRPYGRDDVVGSTQANR